MEAVSMDLEKLHRSGILMNVSVYFLFTRFSLRFSPKKVYGGVIVRGGGGLGGPLNLQHKYKKFFSRGFNNLLITLVRGVISLSISKKF